MIISIKTYIFIFSTTFLIQGAMQKLSKEELKASRMSELKSLLMLDGKSEKD